MKPHEGSAPRANSITWSHDLEIYVCVYNHSFFLFFYLELEDYTNPCLSRKELSNDFLLKLRKYLCFHRSCRIGGTGLIKKLQWHLAEQLLFLACYCESGYITFGGFLRTKLIAHNKLIFFFFPCSGRGEINRIKSQMTRVRWTSAEW